MRDRWHDTAQSTSHFAVLTDFVPPQCYHLPRHIAWHCRNKTRASARLCVNCVHRARQLLLRSTVDAQTTFEHTDGVMHGFHNYVWIAAPHCNRFLLDKNVAREKKVGNARACASQRCTAGVPQTPVSYFLQVRKCGSVPAELRRGALRYGILTDGNYALVGCQRWTSRCKAVVVRVDKFKLSTRCYSLPKRGG